MIGKVHYSETASGSLPKKELRKNYCSGARASAVYSSNWEQVSCLFCQSKHAKVTAIKRRNKLVARLADAQNVLAELRRVAAMPSDPPPLESAMAARQKRIEAAEIEVARYAQGIKDCNALLGRLAAAGAPDHEEA